MAAATLGLIMAGLAAANAATGIIGDRKSAKAARKQGAFEGQMYDKAAEDAVARGDQAANQLAASGRGLTGSQRAAFGAGGIDVNSGSAHDVIANDARLNALDIMTIHNNAEKEAYGLRQQGTFARMGGHNAAAAYNNQAVTTLLGGVGGMIDSYRRFGLNQTSPGTPPTGGVSRYAM